MALNNDLDILTEMSEEAFRLLCIKAHDHIESTEVLAVVDLDPRLVTRAVIHDDDGDEDKTLLMYACSGSHENLLLVRGLVGRGANVHTRDMGDWDALMFATIRGFVDSSRVLLDCGADPNYRSGFYSVLSSAALGNSIEVFQLLIAHGANLMLTTLEGGQNALHVAAENGRIDLCIFLVSRGLDPNLADDGGDSALTMYGNQLDPPLTNEQKEEAVVQLLAAREAYEQRVRDEHWKKNWPLLNTLTGSGLRPMNAEVAAQAVQQAASDKSAKLPGIPRATKAENIAYLNQAIFGRENEHLFLRHIVGFLPRTRFEIGEGEGEEEQEEPAVPVVDQDVSGEPV